MGGLPLALLTVGAIEANPVPATAASKPTAFLPPQAESPPQPPAAGDFPL
jgi:hypothetical protein